jgi:AAA15 family ATPase/GTPase
MAYPEETIFNHPISNLHHSNLMLKFVRMFCITTINIYTYIKQVTVSSNNDGCDLDEEQWRLRTAKHRYKYRRSPCGFRRSEPTVHPCG